MLVYLSTWHAVNACDVCGGAGVNQSLGLLPQSNRHFIGVQYQQNQFSSVLHPLSEYKSDICSDEYYNTVQLWGRAYIGKRLQLFGFIPYRINTRMQDNISSNIQGIGDITLLVNYTLLQTSDSLCSDWKHRLQGGGGVTAPTGMYQGVSELDKTGLPNMQPGTGAWNIPVNANYTIKHKKAGANVDLSYNITTPNKENYKYGNRLNSQLTGFYWLQAGSISILPQVGVRYEKSWHDYDNYQKGWRNEQTGGYIFSALVGAQLYYKKFGIQLSWSKPVMQDYGGGDITAIQRFDTGLLLMF